MKLDNVPTALRQRILKQIALEDAGLIVRPPIVPKPDGPSKRIRQDSKPLMNKLETEWFGVMKTFKNIGTIRSQAKRYRLGNGIFYKPDFTAMMDDESGVRETAWEVKGPHAFRGGFENLKVAASLWPEVRWILVWKDQGEWKQQIVLP